MASRINIDKAVAKFKRVQKSLPVKIGNIALNHFKKSFRDEGFTDKKLDPWQKRKRPNKADRATGRRRAILVDSGNLKRSLKVRSARFEAIKVGSYGIRYAEIHNKGLTGLAFGKHRFKMPKRQFIGDSEVMNKKIRARLRAEMRTIFK